MNVVELVKRGTEEVVALACGACGAIYRGKSLDGVAERCCDPRCDECRGPAPRGRVCCEPCEKERAAGRERECFEKARKVAWGEPWPEGMVCLPGTDRYFDSAEAVIDDLVGDGEWTPYVYATKRVPFVLYVDGLVESALEEHYEEAGDSISDADMRELRAFCEAWAEKTGIVSWERDLGVALLLPESYAAYEAEEQARRERELEQSLRAFSRPAAGAEAAPEGDVGGAGGES